MLQHIVCAVHNGSTWCVLYIMAARGVCCTLGQHVMCAVHYGSTWCVLYIWQHVVCAVHYGSTWCVLYIMAAYPLVIGLAASCSSVDQLAVVILIVTATMMMTIHC